MSSTSFDPSAQKHAPGTAENMQAQCFLVSGRVQGVFFRASTREQARHLGIKGYARNLADGRVEVLAVGSREAVATLAKWLWQGPPSAQVQDVQSAPLPDLALDELSDFSTR